MIKVIITDDHPIVRQGLKQILVNTSDIKVIDEAGDGIELFNRINKSKCDVVLLDISLPGKGGLEILKELKDKYPNLYILVLSVHPIEQYAIRALKLGASGYLTKASVPDELIAAIRKVATGRKYVTSALAEKIASEIEIETSKPLHQILSDREFEVLKMIASGKRTKEIASIFSLSVKTVSTYRERILSKLNINTTADLIRFAIREKIVD